MIKKQYLHIYNNNRLAVIKKIAEKVFIKDTLLYLRYLPKYTVIPYFWLIP